MTVASSVFLSIGFATLHGACAEFLGRACKRSVNVTTDRNRVPNFAFTSRKGKTLLLLLEQIILLEILAAIFNVRST